MSKFHQLKKKKRGNSAGRKGPKFAQAINIMSQHCMVTEQELVDGQKELNPDYVEERDALGRIKITGKPSGTTAIESLYGHRLYNDRRLFECIERISVCLQEFDDGFWEGDGLSIHDLRRDRKNRTWGDEQAVVHLVSLAIATDLAKWSFPRNEWQQLPYGAPYVKFIGPKRNENEIEIKGDGNGEEKTTDAK